MEIFCFKRITKYDHKCFNMIKSGIMITFAEKKQAEWSHLVSPKMGS